MSPTVEEVRKFHVLRNDSTYMVYSADTICQLNDDASYFRFKRDGQIVGEIQGKVDAWWMSNGDSGKKWTIEIPDLDTISFIADDKETDGDKTIFKRTGKVVAVIFVPYHTWATDG